MIRRDYESYIIVDGNFEDIQVEEIIKKFENLLIKNKAEIKNIDRIGRKRMAYQIQRKQNGYYVCFEFLGDSDLVAKLERAYRLDENIMRYLSIFVSPRTMKEKEDYFKKKALIAETNARKEAEEKIALEQAVSAEEKVVVTE